jgi:hypothetical protein
VPLLTVEDYRELVTTSASDEAIQLALDANTALLNRVLGELGVPVVEVHHQTGYETIILTSHRFQVLDSPPSPTIVVGYGLPGAVTLADDDFRVEGTVIRRIDYGTNVGIYWDTPIAITGLLEDNTDERILALVQLVQIDLANTTGSGTGASGVRARTVGKHRVEYFGPEEGGTVTQQKADVLATLQVDPLPVFA